MAVLNDWQKITRVLPGKPFGDGRDGALTISSDTTQSLTTQSCSGTATQSTLTIASGAFTNGDVVIIHQLRGTGIGQWEINMISSGGGSTTLTLDQALHYTYTDSGASQAQVFKLPMYTIVVVDSTKTWTGAAWDQNIGGIFSFAAKTSATITGNITVSARGYAGSAHSTDAAKSASAEGGSGNPGTQATGAAQGGDGSGAGGGYGTAGTRNGGAGNPQQPGSAYGSADLTLFSFGGAGTGATTGSGAGAGDGGKSAGSFLIFVKEITITGSISTNGQAGGNSSETGGGGGSGGSGLLFCISATIGTNLITATGGAAGTATTAGGVGGVGRIAIHHSGTITGTSNPSFSDVSDPSILVSSGGASFLFNFV